MAPIAITANPIFFPGSTEQQQILHECHHRDFCATGNLPSSLSGRDHLHADGRTPDRATGNIRIRNCRKDGADMLHRLEIATGQSAYSITHFSHPCFWRDKQKDLRAIVITHGHDTSSLARIQSTSADTPAEIPTATRPPSSRYSILTNTYTPQLNTHVLVSLSSTFSDIDCLLLGNRSDQQYGRSQHPKHPSIPASSTGIKMASFLQRLGLDASAKTLHLNNPCPPLTSRPDCPNLVPARSVTTRLVDRIRTKLQRHSSVRPAASEEVAASIIRSSPQSFLASSSCLLRSSNTIYCSLGRFEASQKGKDV